MCPFQQSPDGTAGTTAPPESGTLEEEELERPPGEVGGDGSVQLVQVKAHAPGDGGGGFH